MSTGGTTSWKTLGNGNVLIIHNKKQLGELTQNIIGGKWKWELKPYFTVPFHLKTLLNMSYDNNMRAGRKLVKLWLASSGRINIDTFDSRDQFVEEFYG